jgi:lipopolysaccharide/colanic/teichoic acid biosynthesis glycosyltransferase
MLRALDIIFAILGLVVLTPIILTIFFAGWFDTGSPVFRQVRVGRDKKPFTLIKFRTMTTSAPSVATHLADVNAVTAFGKFLRKTKLDELPQLWNVLKGEMSFVGPRPNLFNQKELIAIRDEFGIYNLRPGITGLAQIRNVDMSLPELLTEYDKTMIDNLTLRTYLVLILCTLLGKGRGDFFDGRESVRD